MTTCNYLQVTQEEVDRFREESANVPTCRATVVAGRKAGPLFHKKVKVRGAEEDLSFNIMIPLPTPPGTHNVTTLLVYTHIL